jgi:hypothetical protein
MLDETFEQEVGMNSVVKLKKNAADTCSVASLLYQWHERFRKQERM